MNKITGHIDVVNTCYKWTVSDFSKYNRIGEFIKSPVFSFIKNNVIFEWQLSLYPFGKSSYTDYLFLYFHSYNKQELKLKIKLSFLNYNNEEVKPRINLFTFTKERNTFGCNIFVKRTEVTNEQNCFLKDDELTIKWELINDNYSPNQEIYSTRTARLEQLDYFEKLLDKSEFSDVEIAVDGSILHAHRNLLASKSSIFASMFHTEENKNNYRITIIDMNYASCKEMLRFIYVGKVKDTEKVVCQLLVAANRYYITGLKKLCEDFLCTNIAYDNALTHLQLAHRYNMNVLKESVLAFIIENRKLIIKEPNFKLLGYKLPADLIFDLFCAIVNIDEQN